MNRRRFFAAIALITVPDIVRADDRKKGGGETFIQINTLTATVIRADGRRGVMTVETGIDVPDAALHARAAASTPRLQAAFAQVIQIYASGLPGGGVPNADYLAQQLQRQTDAVLGRPGAKLLMGTILVN